MPSLKDLKNRIASVKATQKITKAMKMVAAAKLRRAQEAAEAARPYSQRMSAVLANIAQAVGQDDSAPRLMTGTGKDQVHLLVVCTAERGLCGGFNSQIARLASEQDAADAIHYVAPVGEKALYVDQALSVVRPFLVARPAVADRVSA